MQLMPGVTSTAVFSDDDDLTYRYMLRRDFPAQLSDLEPHGQITDELVLWVMLNPSTATDTEDDPTVRRCQLYAKHWGYAGAIIANLFAFRATDPRRLAEADDPVGPHNAVWLERLLRRPDVGLVVAAWGAHQLAVEQGEIFRRRAARAGRPLFALGVTKDGHPRHPLYVHGGQVPALWEPLARE